MRRAVVSGAATAVGAEIAARLTHAGYDNASLHGELADRFAAAAAWEEAGRRGPVDVYVHAAGCGPFPRPAPLVGLDDEGFAAAWEQPVLGLLWSLQAAYAHLTKPGASVLVVVPTAGMAGAPGLAATAAAAEAQRLLAKSVARQWGDDGITVNVVAPALAALDPAARDLPPVSLAEPALDPADLPAIADLAVLLASRGARALTGATLGVDGGVWMAP